MNRRKAIQSIVTASAGVMWVSSCEFLEKRPVYSNIPLERSQEQLIKYLSESILPIPELELAKPESTLEFILTMVNDCYAPDDIQKYLAGLNGLQTYLDQNYNSNFRKIEPDKKQEILQYLEDLDRSSEELSFFYLSTKRLTIQQFTSSDYFMTNYLEYEMVPGRFHGCVPA